jgi:hypothetical protein
VFVKATARKVTEAYAGTGTYAFTLQGKLMSELCLLDSVLAVMDLAVMDEKRG